MITYNKATLRAWSTPLTIGAFLVMAVTGVLMFFHLTTGINRQVHEWVGLAFVGASLFHLIANFKGFMKHLRQPLRLGLVLACVAVLGASFFPLLGEARGGEQGKGRVREIAEQLTDIPLIDLGALTDKTAEDVQNILIAEGYAGADVNASAREIVGNNRSQAFWLLNVVLGE